PDRFLFRAAQGLELPPPDLVLVSGGEKGRLLADLHHLARFAGALHTAIKKGRGAHTFSSGRRCPAGADEGMRCAPWPANCPHPAVPATFSPREKERRPRRVCNSTVKRAKRNGNRSCPGLCQRGRLT